jgi:hypothetical protein
MTTTTTPYLELLDPVRELLATHDLPAMSSIQLRREHVSVQLSAHTEPDVIAGLLVWAQVLTHSAAEVWRLSDRTSVHLYVHGRLLGGVAVTVFGGYAYAADCVGADLGPGLRRPVALGQLMAVAR